MLDKKRKKCTKKYIFKCLACSFVLFLLLCYLDGHHSSCASCPLKPGGLKESYGELSNFFLLFFAEMECLSSFLARENHWPSLFFFFF